MLVTEGGHLAHMKIFNNEILPMNNTTFYFVIFILIAIDVVQSSYQKKLIKLQQKSIERSKQLKEANKDQKESE